MYLSSVCIGQQVQPNKMLDTSSLNKNYFEYKLEAIPEILVSNLIITNGNKKKTLRYVEKKDTSSIEIDAKLEVSKEQKSISSSKQEGRNELVTIYNFEQKSIKSITIPSIGFEGNDKIIPLDDGSTFFQDGFSSPSEGLIKIFQYNKKIKKFNCITTINRTSFQSLFFTVNESKKYILVIYVDKKEKKTCSYIEKIDFTGKTIWKYKTNFSSIYAMVEYSNGLGFTGFVNEEKDRIQMVTLLDSKGKLLFEQKVNNELGYNVSVDRNKNQEYLILSNTRGFYTFNLSTRQLNKLYSLSDKNYKIESILLDNGLVLGTAYSQKRVAIGEKIFDNVPNDKVLFNLVEDNIYLHKLEIQGIPVLLKKDDKLYLLDQQRNPGDHNIITKHYQLTTKIKIP
jgi:hypothetical protein